MKLLSLPNAAKSVSTRKPATHTRKKKTEDKPVVTHLCAVPGCSELGEYKAPISQKELTKYRWLCLEHVRMYNANWDYFNGMNSVEIEQFMKDAMYGHRPTWKINSQKLHTEEKLEEALARMLGANHKSERKRVHKARTQSDKERKALAVLNMEGEVSLQEIKKQYKLLVKKHHPDVNSGAKKAEERFKSITEAYQELLKIKEISK